MKTSDGARRKAYRLWAQNPFHLSLRLKCINREENVGSVRITQSYRAFGVLEGDTLTWFRIGSHDQVERSFAR